MVERGCNSGIYRPQWGKGGVFDLNKTMCSIFCSCAADNSSVILGVIGHCKGWRGVILGAIGHCGGVCIFKITPKECCQHLDGWEDGGGGGVIPGVIGHMGGRRGGGVLT